MINWGLSFSHWEFHSPRQQPRVGHGSKPYLWPIWSDGIEEGQDWHRKNNVFIKEYWKRYQNIDTKAQEIRRPREWQGVGKHPEYMLFLCLGFRCSSVWKSRLHLNDLFFKDYRLYQENRYVYNKFKIDCEKCSFRSVTGQGDESKKSSSRTIEGDEIGKVFQRKRHDILMGFMQFPVTSSPFKTHFEELNTRDQERLSGLDLCFQGPVYPHFIDKVAEVERNTGNIGGEKMITQIFLFLNILYF